MPCSKWAWAAVNSPKIVQGVPEGRVGLQEKRRVADLLGQGEELLPQLPRRL